MAYAREPYLVQVNSIYSIDSDGTPIKRKTWLNIYYIIRIYEILKSDTLYKAGARWSVLAGGLIFNIDNDDYGKIITNINGSY